GLAIEGTIPALVQSSSTPSAPPSSGSSSPGTYFINALGGGQNAQGQGQGGTPATPVQQTKAHWTSEEVNRLLENIDPEVAAFWKQNGGINRGASSSSAQDQMRQTARRGQA